MPERISRPRTAAPGLGPNPAGGGKIVHAFAVEGNLETRCRAIPLRWNGRRREPATELSGGRSAEWFDLERVEREDSSSQQPLFDRLDKARAASKLIKLKRGLPKRFCPRSVGGVRDPSSSRRSQAIRADRRIRKFADKAPAPEARHFTPPFGTANWERFVPYPAF
jgi:hypothetical protein